MRGPPIRRPRRSITDRASGMSRIIGQRGRASLTPLAPCAMTGPRLVVVSCQPPVTTEEVSAMTRMNGTTTIVLGILLALVVGIAALDAQDAAEIKLGAFMPISGISADVGAQIKAGTEVAVERA